MDLLVQLETMKSQGKKVVSIEYLINELYCSQHGGNHIPFVNSHQVPSEHLKLTANP